jgi:hypothetical protein
LFIITCWLINCGTSILWAQNTLPATQMPGARIQWSKQAEVTKYRLQIASDEQFRDVLFDRLIDGYTYEVRDLAPGRYYCRVAQADNGTGEFLSGADGSVIWQSGQEMSPGVGAGMRSLAVAIANDGNLIVVGNDRSAAGLRALEVTKMAKSHPQ